MYARLKRSPSQSQQTPFSIFSSPFMISDGSAFNFKHLLKNPCETDNNIYIQRQRDERRGIYTFFGSWECVWGDGCNLLGKLVLEKTTFILDQLS